ncbi:MAG TPA: PAS domain S-box protein [Roseiflexaceae bacterium]|nr:PAS domain S-box protein [Roseiflexaceae bacterium]
MDQNDAPEGRAAHGLPGNCFERIVRSAARLLDAPAALLVLGEDGDLAVRVAVGLEPDAAGALLPLCTRLVGAGGPQRLDAPDLPPLAGLGLLAGLPVRAPDGRPAGALCLLDRAERMLTPDDWQALEDAAVWVESMLSTIHLHQALDRQHRAEAALRASEQRYRSVVEHVSEVIFQADADGRWVFLNPAWSDITGIPIDGALGRPFLDFVYPDDRPRAAQLFHPLIEHVQELVRHELRYLTAGGDFCWVDLCARLMRDETGGVVGISGTLVDITARKHVETELRKISLIASKTENCVIITDAEGRTEWVNDSFTRVTGYTLEDLRGRKPGEVLQGELTDREVVQRISAALDAGEPVSEELLNYRKDGSICWIAMQITPILDANGAVERFVAVQSDITERKRTEEALRESQHFIQRVADAIPQILYVFDLAEQRSIYINREIQKLLGYSAEQIRAMGPALFPAIMHPDDLPRWSAHLLRFAGAQDRDALDLECRVRHADGSWRWLYCRETVFVRDRDGTPRQVLGSAQDITDRKDAEEQLRSSEQRNRALLNAVPDLMFRVSHDGVFLDYKGARSVDLMAPPSEFLGRRITDVMPPDVARRSLQVITQALQTGAVQVYEYQLPIGPSLRDYEARVVASGTRETLLIVRDITDRKTVERMKNEFVSTVSHELRTPLTSIRGALGLVAGGVAGELPKQARSMIEIAHKNSERLVRLINDILDMEKIESGKIVFNLRPQELLPLVEQAVESNRDYAAQFGVTLELAAHGDLAGALVNVDGDRLVQVLTNLISNAAKFSPSGAVVTVAAERRGDLLRMSVVDHGPGIPAEFHSRMFQKFAQADSSSTRRQGGTGLGLSIARTIVERLGGQISFTTAPDRGTTFAVDLPEWREAHALVSVLVRDEQRVLICEDEHDIAVLLQRLLDDAGFQTDVAYTAGQARRLLSERRYCAMTLDLGLPGEDGLRLVGELRADPRTQALPIVIVSARPGQGPEIQGDAFAIVDWLEKPIDAGRLISAVESAAGTASPRRPQVLHIEDDVDMAQVTRSILAPVADVTSASGLRTARELLAVQHFDLVVLDLSLPDGSGLEVLPLLSGPDGQSIPVVVFSALDAGADVARRVGATLVKSRTSNQELQATITALIGSKK